MSNYLAPADRPTGTKLVTVKFASGQRESETFLVPPGATAGEMLQRMDLGNGFQLSKGTPDTVFGQHEPLYPNIHDGDMLFVTSRVDAGAAC